MAERWGGTVNPARQTRRTLAWNHGILFAIARFGTMLVFVRVTPHKEKVPRLSFEPSRGLFMRGWPVARLVFSAS